MKHFWDLLDSREIGVFNSREVALFICSFLFILYCISEKNIRKSLLSLARAAFSKPLIISYLIVIIYSLIPILFLYRFEYWRTDLLKDAIFWFLFSALPVLSKITKVNKDFFRKALLENLKFSAVTEFITSQHTFNIFVEILIILISLLFGGVIAFSERDEKYKDVKKISSIIISLIGIYIFASAAYFFFIDVSKFITFKKFQEFSLPIILGIWFVPLLYLIHVYMVYESVLSTLSHAIDNIQIRKFAQIKAVLNYKFDLTSLKRWKEHVLTKKIKSKEEVLISFLDIKKQQLIEKNPPKVDPAIGWSPYESKNYLNNFGINTGYYRNYYDNDWGANSPYIKLNDEIINNTISYYVSGNDTTVKNLKVNLSVYPPIEEEFALNKFIDCISSLYRVTFNEEIPKIIIQSFSKQGEMIIQKLNKKISIKREDHTGIIKGYSLYFTLSQK